MTEAEWSTDASGDMAWYLTEITADSVGLSERGLNRKLRLVGVACCRRMWRLYPSDAHTSLIDLAERYSEGMATEDEMATASKHAWDASNAYQAATAGPNWQPIDGA